MLNVMSPSRRSPTHHKHGSSTGRYAPYSPPSPKKTSRRRPSKRDESLYLRQELQDILDRCEGGQQPFLAEMSPSDTLKSLETELTSVLSQLEEEAQQRKIDALNHLHKQSIDAAGRDRSEGKQEEDSGHYKREGSGVGPSRAKGEEQCPRSQAEEIFWEYDARWKDIMQSQETGSLSFAELPWPALSPPQSELKEDDIKAFYSHPEFPGRQDLRRVGKAELLRWHPDKFNVNVLHMIQERDRNKVLRAATLVSQYLASLLKKSRSS
ncbi:hypothetical protein NM688_g8582 [Phlebia brevispora]|uniref:Uncharacterized protein n=1 Tax=Phlebia brevispora TaxID=194682 RepID=A0ACC1RTG6_9APHY|nr:hypothetical protein NM688_g8582 [Phlebia brevispora]